MKKHLPSAAVLLVLLVVLCVHTFTTERHAAGSGSSTPVSYETGYLFTPMQEAAYVDYTQVITPITGSGSASELRTDPDILVNGISIGESTVRVTVDGSTYLSAASLLRALFPSVEIGWVDGFLTASDTGLSFQAAPGNTYFLVNGRYLYVPSTALMQENELLLPVRTLASALGCSTTYDDDTQDIVIRRVGPLASAGTYNEEDLYWLSRIIYAESGNQPMKGRIAVGTVILNRVASDHFPNTIKEVIFAPNQFSPVSNGTIYRDPDDDSAIAAMLCLDGVREAGDSLYFNVTRLNSWANKTKTYVTTIGDHKFYM